MACLFIYSKAFEIKIDNKIFRYYHNIVLLFIMNTLMKKTIKCQRNNLKGTPDPRYFDMSDYIGFAAIATISL